MTMCSSSPGLHISVTSCCSCLATVLNNEHYNYWRALVAFLKQKEWSGVPMRSCSLHI